MKTIIQAVIRKDNNIEIESVFLIVCEHNDTPNAVVLIPMFVGAAFRNWYMTDKECRDYVDNGNGINWGDTLEIPDEYLRKQGIQALYPLVSGNGEKKIDQIEFNGFIVVNHDDELFDLGLADDELDGKCTSCGEPFKTVMVPDETGKGIHEEKECGCNQ